MGSLFCRHVRSSLLDEVEDGFRHDWCLRYTYAKRFQRIFHRGNDGRRRGDGSRFADALGAERIHRRRRFAIDRFEMRKFGRRDEEVFLERRRQRLAAVVIAHLFVKGIADAVCDAANDLAVDDHRIDELS